MKVCLFLAMPTVSTHLVLDFKPYSVIGAYALNKDRLGFAMTFLPQTLDELRPTHAVSGAQQRMVGLFNQVAPAEGFTQSTLHGVRLMRSSRPTPRRPVMYEPCIVIVCQGRKRGYLGGQSFVYDAQQYLVLSVPLPLECETEASEAEPFLGIAIDVDLAMVAELLMLLNDSRSEAHGEPRGIYSTPLDATLSDAVQRLLEALASPLDARVLAPSIVRRDLLSRAERRAGPRDSRSAHASAAFRAHREGAAAHPHRIRGCARCRYAGA